MDKNSRILNINSQSVWENFTKNRVKKSEKKGVLGSKKGVLGVKRAFFSVFQGSKSGHFSKITNMSFQKTSKKQYFCPPYIRIYNKIFHLFAKPSKKKQKSRNVVKTYIQQQFQTIEPLLFFYLFYLYFKRAIFKAVSCSLIKVEDKIIKQT